MDGKLTSIRAILDELNGKGKNEPWVELPGYSTLQGAAIQKKNQIDFITMATALKLFVNNKTGELKSYVAKWVDDNASQLLS
jgi:hypothetical protein